MNKDIDYSHSIKNAERLLDILGYWPGFHDAEVYAVALRRAPGASWEIDADFPLLDLSVHLFETTSEVDSKGYFILKKHTMATLRFAGIEDVQLSDFNCQNVILSLVIEPMCEDETLADKTLASTRMRVEIFPAFGLYTSFTCKHVEALSAETFEP